MKFKENNEPRFKTRDEKRTSNRSSRFSEKGKERSFERKNERNDNRKANFQRERSEPIYPTEGRKASGEGSVQIWVKGGNSSKEKKPVRFRLEHRKKLRKTA